MPLTIRSYTTLLLTILLITPFLSLAAPENYTDSGRTGGGSWTFHGIKDKNLNDDYSAVTTQNECTWRERISSLLKTGKDCSRAEAASASNRTFSLKSLSIRFKGFTSKVTTTVKNYAQSTKQVFSSTFENWADLFGFTKSDTYTDFYDLSSSTDRWPRGRASSTDMYVPTSDTDHADFAYLPASGDSPLTVTFVSMYGDSGTYRPSAADGQDTMIDFGDGSKANWLQCSQRVRTTKNSDDFTYTTTDIVAVIKNDIDPSPRTCVETEQGEFCSISVDDEYSNYHIFLKDGSKVLVRTYPHALKTTNDQAFIDTGYQGEVDAIYALAENARTTKNSAAISLLDAQARKKDTLEQRFSTLQTKTGTKKLSDMSTSELSDLIKQLKYERWEKLSTKKLKKLSLEELVEYINYLQNQLPGASTETDLSSPNNCSSPAIFTHTYTKPGTYTPRVYLSGGFCAGTCPEKELATGTIEVGNKISANDISFQVKVTNSTGDTVQDWTTSNITTGTGNTLDFRWSAPAYSRCLQFLGDNGAYVLKYDDGSLTEGNTETADFTVPLRTQSYHIECSRTEGGETRIDTQSINVTVQ